MEKFYTSRVIKFVGSVFLVVSIATQSALACTGIIIRSSDGTTVPARTMEFGFDIQSNIFAVPAGTTIETLGLNPDVSGFTYEANYGFLGANGLGMPIVFDGVNTEGLYFGAFYFAGDAVFSDLTDENRSRAVSSEEMGNWILGQFSTVNEVKAALPTIDVVGTYVAEIDGFAPFHYAVTDASGASIVIEYTASGLTVFDNTVNAVTNNPSYDWHLTNLRNYVGLQSENRGSMTVGSKELDPFGQGSGLLGLPGDHSSPARFVRAVAFANTSLPSDDVDKAIFKAFHILNVFDIPKGSIRDVDSDGIHTDYTLWTSAADTTNARYFYKTYLTQSVESIDVKKAVSSITEPKTLQMESGFIVRDRTGEF
ncbi:linear amide C-N hydrolase [Pseudopelagicola sp. nBUS_20]|uniref:linear amide C-N hydrolase n=1 Tax=Pseudopelagicola sp. nBUS_20 TaxID=3395317 RepID=UPI003EBC515F